MRDTGILAEAIGEIERSPIQLVDELGSRTNPQGLVKITTQRPQRADWGLAGFLEQKLAGWGSCLHQVSLRQRTFQVTSPVWVLVVRWLQGYQMAPPAPPLAAASLS